MLARVRQMRAETEARLHTEPVGLGADQFA
jgi:hypothetical protein